MNKYVALLRGIGPTNPNMHQKKLVGVLESLGFTNVRAVISSGNVVFESDSKNIKEMEAKIEEAWPKMLGFNSTTIIRSQKQLQGLVDSGPFAGLTHARQTYLMVTFFKNPKNVKHKFPYQPPGKPYKLTGATKNELMTVTDNTVTGTTDLMTWLERELGKEITSRTWLTIQRILAKMGS